MAQVRARFREMLAIASDQSRSAKSERAQFQDQCHRGFDRVWKAIEEIKKEVTAQGLGDVTPANVTPNSDRYEVIYHFHRKGRGFISMKFRFLEFTGPNTVTVMSGVTWEDEHGAKQFSAEKVGDAVDHVLAYAAVFYRDDAE